jgi:hypothetical protein
MLWSLSAGADSSPSTEVENLGGGSELDEEASSVERLGWVAGRAACAVGDCCPGSELDEAAAWVGESCFVAEAGTWDDVGPVHGIGAALGGSAFRPECEIHVSRTTPNAIASMV